MEDQPIFGPKMQLLKLENNMRSIFGKMYDKLLKLWKKLQKKGWSAEKVIFRVLISFLIIRLVKKPKN